MVPKYRVQTKAATGVNAVAGPSGQTTVRLQIASIDDPSASEDDDDKIDDNDVGKEANDDNDDNNDDNADVEDYDNANVDNATEEIPIINFEDFLKEMQTKLDTFTAAINAKIETSVKAEFAKTALMIDNLLKKNRATNVSSSLLPSAATTAFQEETVDDQNQGVLELDLLNQKIATVEAIEKLEEDLALPAKVGQYVCITVNGKITLN